MLDAVSEVAGEDPDNRPRLISETVLEPKLATSATPVASSMPTPMGLVPTETSATASFLFTRSTMEAVPAALLATTAIPRWGLIATPWGVAPTGICVVPPNVALAGLMSIMETLLQPLLVTTAMGENRPSASWSAMATELGVAGPELQAVLMSMALITRKSVGLDTDPLLETVKAKRW